MANKRKATQAESPQERTDPTPTTPGGSTTPGAQVPAVTSPAQVPDWKIAGGPARIGRPRRYKTPEDFIEQAEAYLKSCYGERGELIKPITITGMCNYLGTTRERLLGYENGDLESLKDGSGDDEGFRDAIKRVKHICEEYAENHGFTARNPAFAIFALKNYGWKDTQTIESTHTETHTLDPETRGVLAGYIKQLAAAQRGQVIDVTPAREPARDLVPVSVDKAVDK